MLSEYRVRNVVTNGQDHEDIGGPEQTALHRWLEKINRRVLLRCSGLRQDAFRLVEHGIHE